MKDPGPDHWWKAIVATIVAIGARNAVKRLDDIHRYLLGVEAKAMCVILEPYDDASAER